MSEKPNSPKSQKTAVGDTVLVTTREKIAGQNEHAAIITQVCGDDLVNVMVMPGTGHPYPIASVYHVRHSAAAALSWRHRPRERQ